MLFPFLIVAAFAQAAEEPKAYRNLPYVEMGNDRQTLDVYVPAAGKKKHPIVLWIHGGGWRRGDKSNVQLKPRAFTEQDYVFVSTNYRFAPAVTVKEMAGDIAKAIRWVHDHAQDYGGDPNSILVMGHSAGAHLAALVCTDDRYLRAEGLSLAIVKACVPVDVSVYDIPKRLQDSAVEPPMAFRQIFGESEEMHRDLSPVTHVGKGKNIPAFLILHVADRPETRSQSHWFADQLREAGVQAKVVAGEGKTHGTINSELGHPEDPLTQELFKFLKEVLSR